MRPPSAIVGDASDFGSSMTPMIDVVFQLLIFFLCTASFAMSEQVLPTTLPPTGAAETFQPPKEVEELGIVRITLRQQDAGLLIDLNGSSCPDVATLGDRLRQLLTLANLPTVLDIGPEVEMGNVVAVYDTCLLVGVRDVHFAAPER